MFNRRSFLAFVVLLASGELALAQQQPPPPTGTVPPPSGTVPPPATGGRRGGGGGRGGTAVMTLSTSAWADGGQIPARYSQAGAEVSPPLAWSGAPQGTASFVLIAHDADAAANTIEGQLLWMVWNIPATATGLAEAFPQGDRQPDGTRQISQTGPNYRGPSAPASGPVHHYMFELFALDTVLTVEPRTTPPNGGIVSEARTALLAAITGHVRGKAILFGLYRKPE